MPPFFGIEGEGANYISAERKDASISIRTDNLKDLTLLIMLPYK